MARREIQLTCRRTEVLLEAYLDGELRSARRAALEKHLAGCFACSQEMEHARRVRTSLRDLPPRFCDDAVMQRVLDRVRAEPRVAASEGARARWNRWVARGFAPGWPQAAAAAALVIVLALGVRQLVLRTPEEQTFTAADVARAEMQVKWVLGHLGGISEQTARVVRDDVFEAGVAQPTARAVEKAMGAALQDAALPAAR